jgi:hypothetical protein
MPNAAHMMLPLYAGTTTKSKLVLWTPERDKSFEDTKQALISATMLSHPLSDVPLTLTVDASDIAIGGLLQQQRTSKICLATFGYFQ